MVADSPPERLTDRLSVPRVLTKARRQRRGVGVPHRHRLSSLAGVVPIDVAAALGSQTPDNVVAVASSFSSP